MGKVKGKHRLDKFYHLAKEQGLRSRAAYKLFQLDAKYSFLPGAQAVLDLCAAPGGWMQVASKRMPVGSLIIGVDLFPIRPVRGCIAIQEDITNSKCRSTIKKLLADNHRPAFDVILHDGSPNIGGAWAQEATSQNALVIDSLKLATEFLAPKGIFVTKIFRSQDYNKVLFCLRQLFERVEVTKPAASRSTSAEIFIVCLKYKAPAKIDPRLLDIKHLFQEAIEPEKVTDVLGDNKQKRNRGGYTDNIPLVRKVCSATDFVWSESPLELLGTATSISFKDPDSLVIKNHDLTTEEIEALCDDLGVLGKKDFKQLLKWRMNIRKDLRSANEPTSTSVKSETENKDEEDEDEDVDEDEDEKILNEMEELTHAMDRKKKREKKLLAKRRAKDKARKALGKQIDATEDGLVDDELFSLVSIKGKKDLVAVDVTEDVDEELDFSENEKEESDDDDMDSDDERKKYDSKMEQLLDDAYESYVSKREGSTRQRKRAKQAYEDSKLSDVDEDMNLDDSDEDKADVEANPLVIPMNDQDPTQDEIKASWFSQDIFAGVVEDEVVLNQKAASFNDDEMEIDGQQDRKKKSKEKSSLNQSQDAKLSKKASKIEEDDFEIVPAPVTDSSDDSSSSDDESEYDDDTKAEIVACAKKMLRKKQREHILDDAYNKYMFDDDIGLPKWFVDEEKKHRELQKPVTKEEVAAIKAQFKEINARPVKKVAEAKARKKRIAMRQMEKIRKKANTISDQNDIPDRSKRRMIESLYKKATTTSKPKKEFVVAKKGVQVRAGKGKVLVDRRMKSDARKSGMNNNKGKKGKKGGKGSSKASGQKKGKAGGKQR